MSSRSNVSQGSLGRVARRGKILYTLVFLMLLAGLVPLLLTSIRLINTNRDALATSEKLLQLDQTRSIAQQARLYLQAINNQILAIAQTFEIGGEPRAVAMRVQSALRSQKLINFVQEETHIQSITVFNRDGLFLTAGVSLQEAVLSEYLEQSYVQALTGEPWMSPPHVVAEPLYYPVIVISAPIFASTGEESTPAPVAGVVSAILSLEPIQSMVEDTKRGGRDVYVVDERGYLIAHSDREVLFTQHDLSRTVMVDAFQESRGQASSSVNFVQLVDGQSQPMVGTFTSIGNRSSRIPALRDLDWGAIVEAKEQEVYTTVRQLVRQSIYVAVVSAVIAVVFAFIFAGRLSRPIAHLAEGARRLATGDFSQNIDVRSRNEIGELAGTFNLMTAEIRNFIEKLRRAAEENKQMFMGTIRSLAAAIDAKDPYTRGHSERVAHYSEMIAKSLALPEKEVEVVRVGALMHDVGKIGIEDKILGKAGPFTEDEFEIMKLHPMKGAVILEHVRQLEAMIPVMKSHHENIDGSGYPQGLKGKEIPLFARIVSVADTFDAMTTNRPYQKAMEITYVFERMRGFIGTKFDKEIVEALIAAYEEGLIRPNIPLQPDSASESLAAGGRNSDKEDGARAPGPKKAVGSRS
jgi:putative nucleotidyltransferase with HDIG domain